MAYREDEEKRIYELETAESLSAGTFVPVDKEGNELAEKFDLGQLKADLETAINKNSGQLISLQYTDMEGWTLPDGITWRDVAERATCSTVNNSMVCRSAGFIQYPGSERFFQINYRGAVYSDSRSEYEDFLSVYLDPKTYEVLNTVKGKRSDVVGILHDNDGSYSIEVLKNGEYVTGTDAYNWLNSYNIFSIITQTDRLFYPTGSTAYNQPLVYTSPIFSDGSYIIVKVKSDGSVEYEYKSKKVDSPSTAPAAGQVLTFDGTENTWANPPEGVYVINYSEVNDYSDIDIDRATTQPTYIKVDSDQTITIRPEYTNQFTVNIANGTLLRLIEIKSNAWATFTTEQVDSYPGTPNNSGFGASCHLDLMLKICRSEVSETTKVWAASGDIEDGINLFLGEEPKPCTFYYSNGRGTDITSGSLVEKYTGRSTSVQITDAAGNYRRNLLMPAEIQDHDFSTDTTPEQIQFMGWGATSNRAGYRTISEVPASTVQDEGKVLTVDSNGGAVWGQSGFVVTLTEDFTTSPSTLSIDKTFTEINTVIQSSQSIKFNYDKKSPIGTVRVFSGSDVQTVYGSYIAFNCVSSDGKVTSVQLKVDDTVSIVESNNLPTSTSSDEGKVLTVDSSGTPIWRQSGSTKEIYDIRGIVYPSYGTSARAGIVIDKSYDEILAAFNSGNDLRLTIRAKMLGKNESISSSDVAPYFAEDNHLEHILWLSREYQTTVPGTSELGTAFVFFPKSNSDISVISGTTRYPVDPVTMFTNLYFPSIYEGNVCSSSISVQIFTYNTVLISYNTSYTKLNMNISSASDIGIDIPLSVTWDQFARAFSDYSYNHDFPEILRTWDAVNVSNLVFRICEVHMAESVETDNYLKFAALENSGTSYITIFPKDVDGVLQTYWRYVQA